MLLAALAICSAAAPSASAQQAPMILVGAIVEKNYSTQPGVQLSYGSAALLGGRPRFSAAYSSCWTGVRSSCHFYWERRLSCSPPCAQMAT
jgi:hypothetical protein